MLVISALVAVVALFGLLSVARNRRRSGAADAAVLAEPAPYVPAPHQPAAAPDDSIMWRRGLLEVMEAAAPPVDPTAAPAGQENAQEENHRSATELEETGPWSPPSGIVMPTGSLESILNAKPPTRPTADTPPDAVAPNSASDRDPNRDPDGDTYRDSNGDTGGDDSDPDYHGRRRSGEYPAPGTESGGGRHRHRAPDAGGLAGTDDAAGAGQGNAGTDDTARTDQSNAGTDDGEVTQTLPRLTGGEPTP